MPFVLAMAGGIIASEFFLFKGNYKASLTSCLIEMQYQMFPW